MFPPPKVTFSVVLFTSG